MQEPIYMESSDYSDYISIHSLNVNSDLRKDIIFWNSFFQFGYDSDYPPDSCFSSEEANKVFFDALNIEGKHLCERLKKELGNKYDVSYIDF